MLLKIKRHFLCYSKHNTYVTYHRVEGDLINVSRIIWEAPNSEKFFRIFSYLTFFHSKLKLFEVISTSHHAYLLPPYLYRSNGQKNISDIALLSKALHSVIVIMYLIKIWVGTSVLQIFFKQFFGNIFNTFKNFKTGRVLNFAKLQNTELASFHRALLLSTAR